MKKIVVCTTLIALILTACGSSQSNSQTGSPTNSSNQNPGGNRTLNDESKYALGTLKLEGSPQAVDPKLAAKLLPYWQLMKELNSNNSAAPEEFTAVTDQIKATMTPDQLTTIDGMQLTQRDIFTILQADGAVSGGGFQGNNISRNGNGNQTSGNGFRPNGGFPGGGGGLGFNPGFNQSQNNSSPSQNSQAASRTNRFATLLVEQVIKLLSAKIQR